MLTIYKKLNVSIAGSRSYKTKVNMSMKIKMTIVEFSQ